MSNPEEIRRSIERTRAELSDNVNALGDSTSPGNIARGQVDKVKEGAASLAARVFGEPEDPYDDGLTGEARAAVDQARESAAGVVADARGAVGDAPQMVKSRTRGNPLAAGLIALGVGALIGGLIPTTQRERDAAHQLKEAAEPLIEEARAMAMEAKDNLQPLAQEAAGALGDVAREAGGQVKQDAAAATDQVVGQAQSSADTVRGDAGVAVEQTKDDARQAAQGVTS
ncbi:DUF3618 domain-containing protein [Tessaracoccus antarcticus]|uniref:DUF3618 domain-containing protein n=1 Tax=Tessaracoccus antarcticus TaxID=2479848 RepID=A0A3M0G9N2_9ACTN|nr:DUF3618 domain-containing protein [Tessaracoccus antarcticus]RMB61665.1 DUF3618 domain-containing protein [Tessaracoccus antarcticus]